MFGTIANLNHSDKVYLISDTLLEVALLGWVLVSIYMSIQVLRDRITMVLLFAGLFSFLIGAVASIYEHIRPLGMWQYVFWVDGSHCGGFVFLSSSVGYLVFRYVRLHDALTREALTDFLTGIHNRRFFYQRIDEAVFRYKRHSEPFGVAVLDVDDLKVINDRDGHLRGDEVLKEVAMALQRAIRATDCVARFGGDEFVIIFVGAPNKEGVVERLLEELDKCSTTVSIGMAFCPQDGNSADELVTAADKRMYAAKTNSTGKRNIVLTK